MHTAKKLAEVSDYQSTDSTADVQRIIRHEFACRTAVTRADKTKQLSRSSL